jgi:nucleoside recognition membrane protein YjiH
VKYVSSKTEQKITWKSWLSLVLLIIMFSGIFENAEGPLKALDLSNLIGEFGTIGEGGNFRGTGGTGARDGFLFALTLIPTVCLAVGLIEIVEHLGGMQAAGKLFNPILKPLLGIPGITGLAFVSSFTSSDIAAFMTKQLFDNRQITDDERTIFVAYQYAGSAVILNTIGTQAPLLPIVLLPVGPIIVILWICKVFGANLVRILIKLKNKKVGVAE